MADPVHHLPLRPEDLLRLLWLQPHCSRISPPSRSDPHHELPKPIPLHQYSRLLEAMARQPQLLVPRLCLHTAWRQQDKILVGGPSLGLPAIGNLARRGLVLPALGSIAWHLLRG